MKDKFEFKNDKYNITGYIISGVEECKKYKTDYVYGEEDNDKWIFNINGKTVAFWNTGNNIINGNHVIIDNDEMNIITDFDYFKFDLKTLKCITQIAIDEVASINCELLKYRKGFLILCDLEVVCLEDDKVKWVYSASDLLDDIRILDNDIIELKEFYGYDEKITVYLDKDGNRIKKKDIN